MSQELIDAIARERFRSEWDRNFAVSANAGSGKTTAISERLAALALSPNGAELLRKTAVVTYTKKAAAQIGQRARQVLLRRVSEGGSGDLSALDHLERAFFGTIHSFCLKLAQTYGQTLGINLNPEVVAEDDAMLWEEFVEQDEMQFSVLAPEELQAFLRHVPLEEIFDFARELDAATAATLRHRRPSGPPPAPNENARERLFAVVPKGTGRANIEKSQAAARVWQAAWEKGEGFLPLYEPVGSAKAIVEAATEWMAPLKRWLADAAAALGAELAERYRVWRFQRGVQTYADQIDAAMAVLENAELLDRIRREGWRIILDEAQDTDPQQFAVLVELAREPGALRGTWPGEGSPPRPGHFCMVGDGQQAIYGSRADIGNFTRHLAAFREGNGGELLEFQVTFRAPHAVIDLLNRTLPVAFGPEQPHNFGLPPDEGAPAPYLQVEYVPLAAGPANVEGRVGRLPLTLPDSAPSGVEGWLEAEANQVARWLAAHGPAALDVETWGEVAVLAPRNEWLLTARECLERAGLEVALQTRKMRCGDNPVYAWLTGLLAACADPENAFEWNGVLREVFAVSDALLAAELRSHGKFAWEEPTIHPSPLREALECLRPFVLRFNDEGLALATFAEELVAACALREKAWRIDPTGGLSEELDRLLALAAQMGLDGSGPREWLDELLSCIDDGRPAGKPTSNAINLLTSHSAKGLEWSVVIVLGLWRGIGQAPDRGLKLVRDASGPQVYFDQASMPADTRESRERERYRELTRLLYVTLTRPRRTLLIPFADGFGGRQRTSPSFAELWGIRADDLPEFEPVAEKDTAAESGIGAERIQRVETQPELAVAALSPLPRRLLPHQLAHKPDLVRAVRHESGLDAPMPLGRGEEAVAYGTWWHETMEFMPWTADDDIVTAYLERALTRAVSEGFAERGHEELARLRASGVWSELRDARWQRQAELGVLAPLSPGEWIDGVIDLVLHDPAAKRVRIVDWKTNRRASGESDDACLQRLVAEYAPQLSAYGASVAPQFPGCSLELLVYSSAIGSWRAVTPAEPH